MGWKMRSLFGALAVLALAACDGSVENSSADGEGTTPSGYTMEIRASEVEQAYIVIAPDGRRVGARAVGEISALMDDDRVQSLLGEAPPVNEDAQEVMSLRVPGFNLSIGGESEDASGENGQVHINMGGDGQQITINADEGGPGEGDDRAFVRITGADEQAVREFIAEADKLSPEVRTQMLAGIGLE